MGHDMSPSLSDGLHMTSSESPLFLKQLKQAGNILTFSIFPTTAGGWEVKEEAGDEVVRQVRLSDWHRVERAREAFSLKAMSLREAGWVEV
jgi:hypothetical protein